MLHEIKADEHGPLGKPMADAIESCVHCGFCLSACPTYQELGQEMDSPRGRIVLMKNALEGHVEVESVLPHIDRCLGCLACEPACPSGVAYRDLISPFRAITSAGRKRSVMERLRRAMVSWTLPHPNRFRLGAKLGKVGKLFRSVMPASIKPMLDLLPDTLPPKQTWKEVNPSRDPRGVRRGRVALLVGCAQQVLDPDINTATIEVLTRNGVEVIVPPAQGCCGALSWHVGDIAAAQQFAGDNLKAFSSDDCDAIITNAAGCGSGLHEYHLILKGTPFEQPADAFRHRVMDVTTFLAELASDGGLAPFPDSKEKKVIAYHDACHLSHGQGITAQPRELLRMIPGVTVVEVPDAHLCCGSAGTYNIDQPAIAASLGEQKAKNILSTGADLIAAGNIGCMTQIETQLAKLGKPLPIRHTVQILRDAWEN